MNISGISSVALSDNFSVFFHISTTPQTPVKGATVKKQNLNEKTNEMFIKAILRIPPSLSTCVD